MLSGTVILAHTNEGLTERIGRLLCSGHPALHIERTPYGRDVLTLQSLMRADAILMEMDLTDMTGAHLLHELRRDIVNPYVLVCSGDRSIRAEQKAIMMGANGYCAAPVNVPEVCSRLETQLRRRAESIDAQKMVLEEAMLQRVFIDRGISSDLKGYVYLKQAIRLLAAGECSLKSMGELYERIGARFGRSGRTVERDIRYAVARCWERRREEEERPGNAQFLARLMEECDSVKPTLITPRVSVFASGRRVFR